MSADASWAVHKCFEVSSLLSERSGIEVHWECHRSWLFLVLTNAGQRSDLLSGTCSAHAHAAGQLGIPHDIVPRCQSWSNGICTCPPSARDANSLSAFTSSGTVM